MLRKTLKNVTLILTMRCDQASLLISRAQDAPLSGAEKWALSVHLLTCRMCRKYRRQLKLMRDMLARLTEPQGEDATTSFLLDADQARALRDRISKTVRENLDSL